MGGGAAWVLGVTGASGALFARRLLELLDLSREVDAVHLVVSRNARKVIREELGTDLGVEGAFPAELFLGRRPGKVRVHEPEAMEAPVSSGSFPVRGMVVLPCSMGTLAGIVAGTSQNLVQRAAEVQLKEGRPLVLCFREAPLSRVHLRNLCAAGEAGAVVMPLAPPYYLRPRTVEEMVDGFCARVLHTIGIEHPEGTERRYRA